MLFIKSGSFRSWSEQLDTAQRTDERKPEYIVTRRFGYAKLIHQRKKIVWEFIRLSCKYKKASKIRVIQKRALLLIKKKETQKYFLNG